MQTGTLAWGKKVQVSYGVFAGGTLPFGFLSLICKPLVWRSLPDDLTCLKRNNTGGTSYRTRIMGNLKDADALLTEPFNDLRNALAPLLVKMRTRPVQQDVLGTSSKRAGKGYELHLTARELVMRTRAQMRDAASL